MTPYRTSLLAVSLVLAVAGCINLPDIEPDEPHDEPHTEEPLPDLGVRLLTPDATTYTNGAVDVSVEVTNGTPEMVELFAGDELIATLPSPYTFRWDTTKGPEGTYTLTAKARRGPQSFTSEAREVVIDRTPPQVISRTPAPGEQYVSVRQPIQAVFSEVVKRNSVTSSSVRLISGGGVVSATLLLSEDGKTLTVMPETPVETGGTLMLDITGQLTDLAGNVAHEPIGVWSWMVPVLVPIGPTFSAHPEMRDAGSGVVKLNATGNPVVAWSEFDGLTYNIYVWRWSGNSWDPIGGGLSANPGITSAFWPSLQLDAQGNPIVAWVERSDTGQKVHVWQWTGSYWRSLGLPLTAFPSSVLTHAVSPTLLVDSALRPIIAWTEIHESTSSIFIRKWNGSSWEQVSDPFSPEYWFGSSVVLDGDDNPIVGVTQYEDSTLRRSSAHVYKWNGNAWISLGGALKSDPTISATEKPILYRDSEHGVFTAWQEPGRICIRKWADGSWRPIGSVSDFAPGMTIFKLSMATKAGRPVLAAVGRDAAGISNAYVWKWAGAAWEPVGGALSANPGDTSARVDISLQLDAEACPVISWSERDGTGWSLYVFGCNR
jgi:hypothetical protein